MPTTRKQLLSRLEERNSTISNSLDEIDYFKSKLNTWINIDQIEITLENLSIIDLEINMDFIKHSLDLFKEMETLMKNELQRRSLKSQLNFVTKRETKSKKRKSKRLNDRQREAMAIVYEDISD